MLTSHEGAQHVFENKFENLGGVWVFSEQLDHRRIEFFVILLKSSVVKSFYSLHTTHKDETVCRLRPLVKQFKGVVKVGNVFLGQTN